MGLVMVYRYRPMRLCPTITTRDVMSAGSFVLGGHYVCGQGASTGNIVKIVPVAVEF